VDGDEHGRAVYSTEQGPAGPSEPKVIGISSSGRSSDPHTAPRLARTKIETARGGGNRKESTGAHVGGGTAGYIRSVRPHETRQKRRVPGLPKDTQGTMGKAPLTQFGQRAGGIYRTSPTERRRRAGEFLKFFFKPENYRQEMRLGLAACTSCPSSSPTSRTRATSTIPRERDWKKWREEKQKVVEMGKRE